MPWLLLPPPQRRTRRSKSRLVNSLTIVESAHMDTIPPRAGLCGMYNLGNTCYMSSAVQCLMHCPPFIQYMMLLDSYPYYNPNTGRGRLLSSMIRLTSAMYGDHNSPINPSMLHKKACDILQVFQGHDQHDAHELLLSLVSELDECVTVRLPNGPPVSFISKLFGGSIQSSVACVDCGNVSDTTQPFFDLSLAFPDAKHLSRMEFERLGIPEPPPPTMWEYAKTMLWGETSPLTIEQMLHVYCTSERIPPSYHCGKCDTRVETDKIMKIESLGPVLVLHLKRFAHNSYWGSKIGRTVTFDMELDMSPFTSCTGGVYDLCGVVVHSGMVSAGHYIAYCRHDGTGNWYKFDDASVTPVSTLDGVQPYVLVYTRRVQTPVVVDIIDRAGQCNVLLSKVWAHQCRILGFPTGVDNTALCCPHGTPCRRDMASVVTQATWNELVQVYGDVGPCILSDEEFPECNKCLDDRRGLEKRRIQLLDRETSGMQESYNLISEAWLVEWRGFVSGTTAGVPGAIDNSVLVEVHAIDDGNTVEEELRIRQNITLGVEYRAVSKAVWSALAGIYSGGPCISVPHPNSLANAIIDSSQSP